MLTHANTHPDVCGSLHTLMLSCKSSEDTSQSLRPLNSHTHHLPLWLYLTLHPQEKDREPVSTISRFIHTHTRTLHFKSAPVICVFPRYTYIYMCAYIECVCVCQWCEQQAAGRGCFSHRGHYLTPVAVRLTAVVPPNCITLPGDWLTPRGLICQDALW